MKKIWVFVFFPLSVSVAFLAGANERDGTANLGERLFLETRFSQFFFARSAGNANFNLTAGDPVVATTVSIYGPLPGPFAGQAINCRACHLVEEQEIFGNRTYSDFAARSPIPANGDGRSQTPRNAISLVEALAPRQTPLFLHYDGQFADPQDLIATTLTGRNFGWKPTEYATAVSHIAQIIRNDDGQGSLAQRYGGWSYANVFGSTKQVESQYQILPAYRLADVTVTNTVDPNYVSDERIVQDIAALIQAYLETLAFSRDANGMFNGSPYDVFLIKNKLPRVQAANETPVQYSQRLLALITLLPNPQFVTDPADGHLQTHKQAFQFGATELEGLKIFFGQGSNQLSTGNQVLTGKCIACHPAPAFTDFLFHNTGSAQEEYDSIHGPGTCMTLEIPELSVRQSNYDAFLPPTTNHPNAAGTFITPASLTQPAQVDLGLWNVFVSWHSLYTQNQDNIGALEYSIDKGTNWLPVIYYLDSQSPAVGGTPDVITTNGVVDIGATFVTARADQPGGEAPNYSATGTNYGYFILAPITTNLIPYVAGRTNDDQVNGKRIETVRLAQADGQSHVMFRFVYAGTCSWYWGVDEFGLYEINTPVITTQPLTQTIDAATPVTFTVVASSTKPLTYQWEFNGNVISGATNSSYTIPSVTPGNAGQYKAVVKNSDGPTQSSPATLSVNTTPAITAPFASQVADAGATVTFTPTVTGGRPLNYLWFGKGSLIQNANSNPLTLNNVQPGDSGAYQFVVTNSYGAVTSTVALLTVVSGPITNNLVVHLTFDGNLNDSSGRGNNATYATNGTAPDPTPTFVAGKIGQAFQYTTLKDGSKNDYATLGYPPDLMLDDSNAFAVSFWVNYTNQSDDLPFISNKDWNSSGNQGWGFFCQSGGNFRLNLTGPNGGSDKFDVSPTTTLRDGAWHNLVVSVARAPSPSAGNVYTYVDGTLVNLKAMVTQGSIDTATLPFSNEQGPGPTNPPLPDNQTAWAVNIGQDGTGVYHDQGSAYNIGAHIDDLGIWRRALSAGEAAAIFAAGQTGKDLSQAVVSTAPGRPTLTITLSGTNLKFTWQGTATGRLQTTTILSPASWADVAGTTGASSATVPIGGLSAFFRVKQ